MHGPDPEKQNCILSKANHKAGMEKHPPLGTSVTQSHLVSPSVPQCHQGAVLALVAPTWDSFPTSWTALLCRFFPLCNL